MRVLAISLHPEKLRMVRRKDFGSCMHALVLGEEAAHIACKLPVFGRPGGVQCSGSLFIRTAYLLPPLRATRDKCRQCCLAARDGDGLFVGAPIRIRHLTTSFGSQPCPKFDEGHARPCDPSPTRASRGGFGGNAARAQLTGKAFSEAVELDRAGIEARAIQPLGLHRQMHMGARRVGVEGQDIIVIVA